MKESEKDKKKKEKIRRKGRRRVMRMTALASSNRQRTAVFPSIVPTRIMRVIRRLLFASVCSSPREDPYLLAEILI